MHVAGPKTELSQQVDALSGQGSSQAYKHAMRSPEQSKARAKKLYKDYINNNRKSIKHFIRKYRRANCPCKDEHFCAELKDALRAIGEIFHAVSDRHSPVHGDFEEWPGEIGATKGGLVAGSAAVIVGASGWGILIAFLLGTYVGSGAIGHGDLGDEGPDDYERLPTNDRLRMEADLAKHLSGLLKKLHHLCGK